MKDPIDIAGAWLSKRNAAYLAKENVIVYYTTTTGRKSDYQWITHTLVEVVRIIRATLMNPEDSDKALQSRHIIAACQELDRVFEFGVKSNHDTLPNVFNYMKESGESMGDAVVSSVATTLYQQDYKALLLNDVYKIIEKVMIDLAVPQSITEIRELIFKHFGTLSYEIRTGANRPVYMGKKQNAVMLPSARPKEIISLEDNLINLITNKIVGALK